ncbi:MAG: hypothetical protein Q9176_006559 [Flavoplaca citrina]
MAQSDRQLPVGALLRGPLQDPLRFADALAWYKDGQANCWARGARDRPEKKAATSKPESQARTKTKRKASTSDINDTPVKKRKGHVIELINRDDGLTEGEDHNSEMNSDGHHAGGMSDSTVGPTSRIADIVVNECPREPVESKSTADIPLSGESATPPIGPLTSAPATLFDGSDYPCNRGVALSPDEGILIDGRAREPTKSQSSADKVIGRGFGKLVKSKSTADKVIHGRVRKVGRPKGSKNKVPKLQTGKHLQKEKPKGTKNAVSKFRAAKQLEWDRILTQATFYLDPRLANLGGNTSNDMTYRPTSARPVVLTTQDSPYILAKNVGQYQTAAAPLGR